MRLMQHRLVGFGVAALLGLMSASVWAAPQGGGAGGKGETGGKGGLGPANSSQSGASGTQEGATGNDVSMAPFGGASTKPNPDTIARERAAEQKPWEVSATFETHRLLMQQYVADVGSKTFNVFFMTAKYLFTDSDIITLAGGAQQLFLADPGEPGVRAFDLSLSYTHIFQLPEKFRLSTTGTLTAPIGFYSQLASNITSPSVSVGLSRRFGDLTLSANIRGTYFWDRYTSQAAIGCGSGTSGNSSCDEGSGQPNTKWATGGALSAEYAMPFHRQLSVGAVLSDSYVWFYDVGQGAYNGGNLGQGGATSNPTVDNNPFMQSYGGEVFARYIIPDLGGFKSDFLVALANGDPSLGYPAVLHDGVVHPYFLYYNTAEVYFALEGRY
jgi:hypothetical protein